MTQKDIDNEKRAINKLCLSSHPNIVQVFKHGSLAEITAFYFIDMELCDCNLEEYIHNKRAVPRLLSLKNAINHGLGPLYVCRITQQITDGLKFMHDHNEVHRDFSPQNGSTRIILVFNGSFIFFKK